MPTNVDAWGVLPRNIADFARDAPWLTVVARLRDGVTLEQAQQEMDAVATRLREVHPFHKTQNLQIRANGLHRDVVNHARPAPRDLEAPRVWAVLTASWTRGPAGAFFEGLERNDRSAVIAH